MLPMLPMLPTLPPLPKHRESPPRAAGGGRARSLRWRGRLLAVAKAPAAPSQAALPAPPPHSDAARATVALDCYCAAGGVTVYSHGRRDRRTRTAGSTGSPPVAHPRGSPRRRRRGGGGPVGGGPPPGAVGAHMQDAAHRTSTLTVRGGGRRAVPSGAAGTMGTPSSDAPSRPAAPHLPSRRGPGAPRGPSPPGSSRRICALGSRGAVSPSRVPVPCPPASPPGRGGTAGRSGAGLAAGPARRGLNAAGGAGAGAAGGGRRLHNPPGAARRFLSGEVRAARPAPAPGTGPSAAGGDRCWPGRAPRGGHWGLTALETARGGWKGWRSHRPRREGCTSSHGDTGDVGSGPSG
ncbi:collagen alpha-1(I) chain-like [Motacilla alba alba]|uniref:collagen alpha-1(I) chain-like n=1 Tax=Motacilla alba alba TaxID=1094192 RepID=UPI0018D4E803|nr:collagen alpha-1(I) chain-like [Motacilla alba alba]